MLGAGSELWWADLLNQVQKMVLHLTGGAMWPHSDCMHANTCKRKPHLSACPVLVWFSHTDRQDARNCVWGYMACVACFVISVQDNCDCRAVERQTSSQREMVKIKMCRKAWQCSLWTGSHSHPGLDGFPCGGTFHFLNPRYNKKHPIRNGRNQKVTRLWPWSVDSEIRLIYEHADCRVQWNLKTIKACWSKMCCPVS